METERKTMESSSNNEEAIPTATNAEPSTPTTAAATTANILSSTPTLRADTPPSPLLREWNQNENNANDAIPTPPVAPAVVLNETSDSTNNSATQPKHYSYPVATFVSNFVRTSVSDLRDHIGSHISATTVPPGELQTVSMRSDSELMNPLGRTASTATATGPGFPTIRSVNLDLDDSEFVLVDGDLVAIPAPPPNDIEMDFQQEMQRANCRASRMRRGVKGLKKWIKKKKMIGRRSLKQQMQESQRQVEGRRTSGTSLQQQLEEEDASVARRFDEESVATTTNNSTTTAGVESSPPRKLKKKKKKKAWRKGGTASSSGSRGNVAALSDVNSLRGETTPLTPIGSPLMPSPPAATMAEARPEPSLTLDVPAHSLDRMASIAAEASFVGNADQVLAEAGVLQDLIAAEAYIEDRLEDYDKYDKKDYGYPYLRSVVPRDADIKVDKQEAPCVDSMLRRAGELAEDLESSMHDSLVVPPEIILKGKSDGASVPLSNATSKDPLVHNDMLKLVLVGDPNVGKSGLAHSLRKSQKKCRKRKTLGVDVHSWTPPNDDDVKFTIWDVQGAADQADPLAANFGAHPGTQSLFFSDRSLYLLVWDLASSNWRTFRRRTMDDSDDDDDEEDNEYEREEADRQADRALQTDIEDRVLSWVDCIARRGSHSAILPVAIVPTEMSPEEAKRRCDIMQTLLTEYTDKKLPGDLVPPKVLSGAETVLCVSLNTNMGMDLLEETILAIATDASHSVFDHVGTPVPPNTVHVLETIRRLKSDHKLVLVDHLMAELQLYDNVGFSVENVIEALNFLASIGEVLYYGATDDVLSQYVILSRKWLVSALSCILRNDLKRELTETRRFMNMQCLYSNQQFPENNVTQTFSTSSSSCPLLSSPDTQMLWQSMSFMREAADKSLFENSTTASTMFGFLEHLLVHTGVFLPLDIDRFASPDNVYFVPSLLAQANSRDIWTFKSSDSWMTTLSHSWLFRDGAPVGLMEHVTVALLRDLFESSHLVAAKPHTPQRSRPVPFAQNALTDSMDPQDGRIKIHQMMCWKSSLLIKIGCVFEEGNELRESFVEIFVAIADPSSPHCVASDTMRSDMQRLVVSGKGQVGHHGQKLWRGGFRIVLDSIKASVAHCTNVDRQVVCTECLANSHPCKASTWSWDSVRAAAESGSTVVRCMRGHRVDSSLIAGTCKPALPKAEVGSQSNLLPKKSVRELLPSVVFVGLYDPNTRSIRDVGSGFIVDKKQGLIITAGHILFDMTEGRHFGSPYKGLQGAKAVIGVIPEGGNGDTAVFRYFADIVAEDIHNVDACVLKVSDRMENDVDSDALVGQQPKTAVNMQKEQMVALKMTRQYELEETIRILGFNQGGEGLLEQGKHFNRSADFAKGYICKQFKLTDDHSSNSSLDSSSSCGAAFAPREEIVVICPNIVGHSGGPCVNHEGKVVGILSRADPVDPQRCYLVPSSELKTLLKKAKQSSRVGSLKMF